MDEIQKEQPREAVRRRPRKRKRGLRLRLPGLPRLPKLSKEDVRWYFDVRLYVIPVVLLLLLLSLLRSCSAPAAEPEPTVPAPTVPVVETLPEPEPTVRVLDPDAEALARLADSVGSGRSKNVKTIIMWIAINRSEDRANGYGKSLIEEIERPEQWQGYDPNCIYSETSYQLAEEVLRIQRDGDLRPLDTDMLWLVLNDNGSVTVRNQFVKQAQNWREKTFK